MVTLRPSNGPNKSNHGRNRHVDSEHALRIALVAGEASGDVLGAGLIRELRKRYPAAQFAGVGGDHMRTVGFDAWSPCDALAVMGLGEVLAHLPRLLRLRAALRRRLLVWQPHVFIGIDAPDFNLRLERALKARGIATVHYVSPSVWAWRAGRAARIGRSAQRVLCLFPMEPAIYARHGVDAVFVGHPLADRTPLATDREGSRARLGIPPGAIVLALLPGSRGTEIERLAPVFLDATAQLLQRHPDLWLVAPMASARCRAHFERHVTEATRRHERLAQVHTTARLLIIDGNTPDALSAADVAVLASGTAALEALLAKCPTVIGYIVAPLTAWLVRTFGLIKSRYYALPNVLADAPLMPELLQENCTAVRIADALDELLSATPAVHAEFVARCTTLHATLRCDADARASDAIAEVIEVSIRQERARAPASA